jgi:asparaginyl-tRNA synthetase
MLKQTIESNLTRFIAHIESPRLAAVKRIETEVLNVMCEFALKYNFIQILPIMLSPITDTLNHDVYPAELVYMDRKLKLTASMIFHKQLALMSPEISKLFIVSPNIRLEKEDLKSTQNHLIEFTQFDIEMKGADRHEVMGWVESLIATTINRIRETCTSDLETLGRRLPKFELPFPRYRSEDRGEKGADEFYDAISGSAKVPCFMTNFKREFYDKEDNVRPGTYRNFDLIYPEGFGEAASGAERTYEYHDILRRMKELDLDPAPFKDYLELAKCGKIPATAGAGIGIQRLVKFITGHRDISQVCLFDRSVSTDLLF